MSAPEDKRESLDVPENPWWSTPDDSARTAREAEQGTLVAGPGVPPLDTRGAVPAEPVTPDPRLLSGDTDPGGFPAQDAAPSSGRRLPFLIGAGIAAAALAVIAAVFGLSGDPGSSTAPATPGPHPAVPSA